MRDNFSFNNDIFANYGIHGIVHVYIHVHVPASAVVQKWKDFPDSSQPLCQRQSKLWVHWANSLVPVHLSPWRRNAQETFGLGHAGWLAREGTPPVREGKERERECVGGVSECKILMCACVFVCVCVHMCVCMCAIIVQVCGIIYIIVWSNYSFT